jgi:predicted KAP-like P-loop ATPase
MTNFDDVPITSPDKDRFGFDPFASAISDCIRSVENPLGSVVAIYGPWGSGKSSVINLVRHHLANDAPDLNVINFPAWMYRTEDALAMGFFKELYAGLSPVLSDQTKAAGALRKLGANLSGASSLAGMAVGLFAGSLGEKATTATLDALGGFIEQGETAEDLQETLADALREAGKKFLVVIDDLDRLSPEEALVIFRLVKSVGRLPNVMYLLAYDRETTEQAVARRFPSEGAHYLEKIIQAGFELPQPDQSNLNVMMGEVLDGMAADLPEIDPVEFGNLFHSIVVPELKTPRDVLRLANTLSITFTPIKSDVFLPDFVSLETLRVFRPAVYRAIRQNKSAILNAGQNDRHDQRDARSAQFTSMLLRSEPEEDHGQLREALMRLFPQLENVFANMSYSGTRGWARQRRLCSTEHFDTYFRFSVSPRRYQRQNSTTSLIHRGRLKKFRAVFVRQLGSLKRKDEPKPPIFLMS